MDCLTIPKFDREQIAICEKCKHISGKKIWCCKWGIAIKEKSIIQYPSKLKMAGNLVKATGKHIKSGFKKRSDTEQLKCIEICQKCEFYKEDAKIAGIKTPRCTKCGCCSKVKTRWVSSNCPIGKW